MMIIRVCFSLLVLLGCSMGAVTQDLSQSIESSIQNNESDWQLSAKKLRPAQELLPHSTSYWWKSGEQSVVVEVFVNPSEQTASALLRQYAFRIPVAPKEELKDLGDQALLYQSKMLLVA